MRNNIRRGQTITIIQSNYLKNLREELLEEEGDNSSHNNNEIAYITAEINGVQTRIMIDTGANVSLINGIELNKIQGEGKTPILTLPIINIILVGATGWQNKTVRRQVRQELSSNGETILMTFLVTLSLIHI